MPESSRKLVLYFDLQSHVSVAAFESNDQPTFRANLEDAVAKAVLWKDDDLLFLGIDWAELCHHHDHSRCSGETPLEMLRDALCNPVLIPTAFSGRIFISLLRVMEKRQSETKSQSIILRCMLAMTLRLPAFIIKSALLNHVKARICSLQEHDSERIHHLVSTLRYLGKERNDFWFRSLLVQCFCRILQRVDDDDIELLESSSTDNDWKEDVCLHCQKTIVCLPTSSKMGNTLSLSQMLDEQGPTTDQEPANSESNIFSPSTCVNDTLCVCSFDERDPLSKASNFTRIHFVMILLRSRLYKKVLSAGLQALPLTHNNKPVPNDKGLMTIDNMVKVLSESPLSPSLRLSLIMMAGSIGPRAYQHILNRLWTLWMARMDAMMLQDHPRDWPLRVYSEVLAECSHYDDPRVCWDGMKHLVNHLLEIGENFAGEPNANVRSMLRCVSHLLIRRQLHLTIPRVSSCTSFTEFLNKLSVCFGEARFWVDAHQDVNDNILHTMRMAGVIGIIADEGEQRYLLPLEWPFPRFRTIRAANERMGPRVSHRTLLLSNHDFVLSLQTRAIPRMAACGPSVPVMDYLHNDMLRTVMSFLGCKRLVYATLVCKSWRAIIHENTMWKDLYIRRYGIGMDDPTTQIASWRDVFVAKWNAEKALRFKRNKDGWKYRTCDHIGCLMVMRSPQQQARHRKTHQKRSPVRQKRRLTNNTKTAGKKRKTPQKQTDSNKKTATKKLVAAKTKLEIDHPNIKIVEV